MKRRLPASTEALESTALRDSGTLGVTIWSIPRSCSGHRQNSEDSREAGKNGRFDKKVWLSKGRNLRRTGKLHLD